MLLGPIISRLFTGSNAEKNKLKKTKVACSSPISMARTKYCILFGSFVSNEENRVVNSFDSHASWRGWKLVGVLFMLNVYEMNSKSLGNFPFPRKLVSGANFTKLFRAVIYISAKQT